MGNKLGRRRQVVDERYTKPQGLYVHKDVDHKKLRRLILESKLAPCYPGEDEVCNESEECPICFLYYPSLNRSRCCLKGICTECFLQMKNPNSTRPTQCPFCKTSNYAVEYRGIKTKEEKGLEQIEEQRVIEAKIRMRQQELQEEEGRMQKRLDSSASSSNITPSGIMCASPTAESEEISFFQHSIGHSPHSRTNRHGEFDVDLEDIMVMEAIWMSIQENDKSKNPALSDAASSRRYTEGQCTSLPVVPPVASTSSPSGGLACAIAALAERQQISGQPPPHHQISELQSHRNVNTLAFNVMPGSSSYNGRQSQGVENYPLMQHSSILTPDCSTAVVRDETVWSADCRSDTAGVGASYASPSTMRQVAGVSTLLPPQPQPQPLLLSGEIAGSSVSTSGLLIPESFEEQMMMAMAVSLAETRVTTSGQASTWQ